MLEALEPRLLSIIGAVNAFLWGPGMLAFFLLAGLMFTVRLKVFQLTHFKLWMRETFLAIFTKRSVRTSGDGHSISQFQALSTALAATVGTGNIAGVASAIALGGPGAVFWMWLSAFLGMATSYAENTLGIKYRYRDKGGAWVGGAMVYMERALGAKWLAALFCVFCLLSSFGIGNMAQVNSVADALRHSFAIPPPVTGLLTAAAVGLVVMGGIKRIAAVTEKLVPLMVVAYVAGCLACIVINMDRAPEALGSIFSQAFGWRPAAGGAAGYGVMRSVRMGVSRGVFSNEAGLGSSVMAHSACDVSEPVKQGMWGMFEVFTDTIVMCTLTALVILTSGVYDTQGYLSYLAAGQTVTEGAALTTRAMSATLGNAGAYFVPVALALFAFSTILGWSYYGERGVEYLLGRRFVPLYRALFVAASFVGAVCGLRLVWGICDTFNGLMAIPNLAAITLLSGRVIEMTTDYFARNAAAENPPGRMEKRR